MKALAAGALAALDVLMLLNIAALRVEDHPARLLVTLPIALGHAFWSAWLCSQSVVDQNRGVNLFTPGRAARIEISRCAC